MNEENRNRIKALLLKIAFIVGVFIAVVLLAIGIVRLMPTVFSYIGSATASLFKIFKPAPELIITSSKETIKSGEAFTFSWATPVDTKNNTIEYPCNDDLQVYFLGENQSKINVPCGKEFKLGPQMNSASFLATLGKPDIFADITFTIKQTQADDSLKKGEKLITVTSGKDIVAPIPTNNRPTLVSTTTRDRIDTPAPRTPTGGGTYMPQYFGPADLTISGITSGVIHPQTGIFVPKSSISSNEFGAIQFTVTNKGGTRTGYWRLSSTLPGGNSFESTDLAPLSPGGSALFTLQLGNNSRNGTYSIVVVIDPRGQVIESNEQNNTAAANLTISGGSSGSSNKADLEVRIIAVGYINPSTGRLATGGTYTDGKIGVQFEIRNNGGRSASNFSFEAELPTFDDEVYESNNDLDLNPGEAMELTIGFDNVRSNGFFDIAVDPEDEIDESDERNNTARVRVTN